jgi:preprotein translocase subunit SecG
MGLIIGILTFFLVLTSLLLMLLILIQLPKKEAGLGVAFGSAATDALFGAGSGTVLSKMTKYGTVIFLSLSLLLAIIQNHQARASGRNLERALDRKAATATPAIPGLPPAAPANKAMPLLQPGTLTSALPPALKTVLTNAPAVAPGARAELGPNEWPKTVLTNPPATAPARPRTNAAPSANK